MSKYIEEYKKIFSGGKFIRNNQEITLKEYRAFDGGGARTLYTSILKELESRDSVTILDYGCGEGVQWHDQILVNKTKSLPNLIGSKLRGFYRYDPAYEIYNKKPTGTYDFIICADVLEHIPNDEVDAFLDEVNSYATTNSIIFYSISTIPSSTAFLDGKNMHINLQSPETWLNILRQKTVCKIYTTFNGKYNF